VYPIVLPAPSVPFNLPEELNKACEYTCAKGFADPKTDLLTVTAGLPFGVPG